MGMSFDLSIGDNVETNQHCGEIIHLPSLLDDESLITVFCTDGKSRYIRAGAIVKTIKKSSINQNKETIYRVVFRGDFHGRTLRQTLFVPEYSLRQRLTELFDKNCQILMVRVISQRLLRLVDRSLN